MPDFMCAINACLSKRRILALINRIFKKNCIFKSEVLPVERLFSAICFSAVRCNLEKMSRFFLYDAIAWFVREAVDILKKYDVELNGS